MIEKVKNNKFVFIFSMAFVILVFLSVCFSPMSVDSFQLFANAHMMKLGKLLYKDVNVITPPLVHYINYLGVLICDQVFILKVIHMIYLIITAYVGYCINLELSMSSKYSLITSCCVSLAYGYFQIWGYNALCVLCGELSLLILLKGAKKTKLSPKEIVLLGILCGANIMSKQSMGLAFTVGVFIGIALIIYKNAPMKFVFKSIIIFGLSIFISVGIILLPVVLTGSFPDFLDQVVFGLSSFKLDYFCSSLLRMGMIAVFLTVMFVMSRKSLQGTIVYVVAITSLSCMLPTANLPHFSCCWVFVLYSISYYIKELDIDLKKPVNIVVMIFTSIAALSVLIIVLMYQISDRNGPADLKYTRGMYYNKELISMVNDVNKYIESHSEHEYRIISTYASLFNINRDDSFYKYYDMILEGNTGTVDPLEMIKEDSDKYYFIADYAHNTYSIDWQINEEIFNYLYSDKFVMEEMIGNSGLAVYRLKTE